MRIDEALRFYAAPQNYVKTARHGYLTSDAASDGGEIATEALRELEAVVRGLMAQHSEVLDETDDCPFCNLITRLVTP